MQLRFAIQGIHLLLNKMVGNQANRHTFDSVSIKKEKDHKIIVGIDYGTTFQVQHPDIQSREFFVYFSPGVSYATTDKRDIDINIITAWLTAWPGEPSCVNWKTPMRISYKRENPKLSKDKWGFEVDHRFISYSWTKLLLDKNALFGEYDDPALENIAGNGVMKLPDFRKAEEVCGDFLHELYLFLTSKLHEEFGESTYETNPHGMLDTTARNMVGRS